MQEIDYQSHQKPTHFMKVEEGVTRLRILSKGVTCYEHGSRMGGKYVPLGVCPENVDCEHCQKGLEPKLKYRWVIFEPKTNLVKVLSTGSRLGEKICVAGDKAKNMSFEILITKQGCGISSNFKVDLASESTAVSVKFASYVKQACDYLNMRYLKYEN